MKAIKMIIASAAAILAVACAKKEIALEAAGDGTLVFTATLENAAKSTITEGKWAWEAGDKVLVTDGSNQETVTLTAEDITDNGAKAYIRTTTIPAGAAKYFAVTPPRKYKEIVDGAYIKLTAASSYTSDEIKTVIAATTGSTFAFKNVFSLLKFDTKLTFDHATMTATNIGDDRALMHVCQFDPETGEYIWGDFATVNPTLSRGENESGPYYIEFVPHALPNGFTLTLYDDNENVLAAFTRSEALTPVRGHIYNIADFDSRYDGAPKTAVFTLSNASKYGFSDAGTVTGVTSDDNGKTDITISFADGTSTQNSPKYYANGTAVRCYAGNTMTINGGVITKIVCTYAGNTYLGNATTTPEGYTTEGVVGTWTGEAEQVVFSYGAQCRLQKVEVTYKIDSRTAQTLSFPKEEYEIDFGDSFTAPQVSGAQTAVTYESSEPAVATVDPATGAVTVLASGTTFIKATAAGNATFRSATASYKLVVNALVSGVSGIRAAYGSSTGDVSFKATLTDAVVTYVSGKYAFVEDTQAGIVFYNSSADIKDLVAGQKINGKISGTVTSYNKLLEINSWDLSAATITTGATIPVTTLTPQQLEASYDRYQSCRVKMENVQVDASEKTIADFPAYTYNGVTLETKVAEVVILYPSYYKERQVTVWEPIQYKSVAVTGVSVDPATLSLEVGASRTITATVAPADALNKNVSWSTDNASVATVSASGEVTAVAAGSANITATTQEGGFTATCAVTVSAATSTYSRIDFEGDASTYTDWKFVNLSPKANKITAHGGSFHGINATSATSTSGTETASITTVNKLNPKSVTFYVSKTSTNTTKSNWYVKVSSDGTNWTNVTSQDACSMNKGDWVEVSADLSSYTGVFVRIAYDGSSAIRAIDDVALAYTPAAQVAVTGVSLNKYTMSIEAGAKETLVATVSPDNASVKAVSWSSDNTSVATVNASGEVTAVAVGTANVKATTRDGGFTASCAVTVTASTVTAYYELVTTAPTDWTGRRYLIVSSGKALTGSATTATTIKAGTAVTISDSKITATAAMDAISVTIETDASSGYLIKTASGYYIYNTSSGSNGFSANVNASTANKYAVTLGISGGNANITAAGSYLRWNSGNSIFQFYKSASYTAQTPIQLYRRSE